MTVTIWSDIVCPFCYIGKRRFETALENFAGKKAVNVEWKSFQLDPNTQSAPGKSLVESLAASKGWSIAQAQQAMNHVTAMAKEVGLEYHMEKAVVANTFDAHRLVHLAKEEGLQDAAEERLFSAYFIEGLDIGDRKVLAEIGAAIGLDAKIVTQVLSSEVYSDLVRQDIEDAANMGVQGVPFFVFNNKYAVSGAQPASVFQQVLDKVWQEEQPLQQIVEDGGFCTPEGICS